MLSSARTFTYSHHDWPSKVDVPGSLAVCANAEEVIKRKKIGRRKPTAVRGMTRKARLSGESLKLPVFRRMINSFHNFLCRLNESSSGVEDDDRQKLPAAFVLRITIFGSFH